MGLNAAFSIAATSLEIFSTGIQVAGENIANAQTPGYVRNELSITTAPPVNRGGILLGNGAVALGVRQRIDAYLQKRIYSANSDATASTARNTVWKQLEGALQEMGSGDISTAITSFVGKLSDLANQPEDGGVRQLAVEQARAFATTFNNVRSRVDQLRSSLNGKVSDLTAEANKLIDQIGKLNPQITSIESAGLLPSDAGGLRNQRLAALDRLSEILPIHTIEQPTGSVDVYFGSESLVLQGTVQHLETTIKVDHNVSVAQVRIEGNKYPVTGTQGELNGVLNGRDNVLGNFTEQLDTLAASTIFEFNKLHASGQGTRGYTSLTASYVPADPTTALNASGLPFAPKNGSFQVRVTNKTTGVSTTTNIAVDLDGLGTDTSLTSLTADLDGVANMTASFGADRKLQLAADPGYEITFANDTSDTLASLGINTFFTGTNSYNIGVNSVITNDPAFLATGRGGGAADGSNAVALAQFADSAVAGLKDVSISDYYQNVVSLVAQSSASEDALSKGYESFRGSLLGQRDQYSGVSLDEEVVRVMQLQRSFQMSGKMISTIDELFRTLLQL